MQRIAFLLVAALTSTTALIAPSRSFPVARRPQRAQTCRMLFDKFDAEAVNVLMYAQQETRSAKLGEVGTEQVLLGVLQCPENAKKALDRFGVTLDAMRDTMRDNNNNCMRNDAAMHRNDIRRCYI